MSKTTIKKARKILGKLAESVSDEQLQKEIDTSNFLADLFFLLYKEKKGEYNEPTDV